MVAESPATLVGEEGVVGREVVVGFVESQGLVEALGALDGEAPGFDLVRLFLVCGMDRAKEGQPAEEVDGAGSFVGGIDPVRGGLLGRGIGIDSELEPLLVATGVAARVERPSQPGGIGFGQVAAGVDGTLVADGAAPNHEHEVSFGDAVDADGLGWYRVGQ